MNEKYLDEEVTKQIRMQFEEQGIILLDDFLLEKDYVKLKKLINSKGKKEYLADSHSYTKLSTKIDIEQYINQILGKKIKIEKVSKFEHKDFTLLHDNHKSKESIEIGYFICSDWKADYGGNVVYSDGENPIIIPIKGNRLFIINKPENVQNFVKYVNCLAGKNKFVLVKSIIV